LIQSTGVAIPTLDHGLVDADHVHCAKVDQPELALKRTVMDLLSRLANSKPHHDLFDRQPHARGGAISHSQLRRQALVAIELWHHRDAALETRIHAVHAASTRRYGSLPQVHAELQAQGECVGQKRIAHIMHTARFQGQYARC